MVSLPVESRATKYIAFLKQAMEKRPYDVDRDMQNVKTKINISDMKETFTSGVA